jgi:hypothetical protein
VSGDLPRPWRRLPDPPPTPLWFKAWFAFCAVVGLGFLGLLVWLIVEGALWLSRH